MPSPAELRVQVTTTEQPAPSLLDWWRNVDFAGWEAFTRRSNRDQVLDADQYGEAGGIAGEEQIVARLAVLIADGLSPLAAAQHMWGQP